LHSWYMKFSLDGIEIPNLTQLPDKIRQRNAAKTLPSSHEMQPRPVQWRIRPCKIRKKSTCQTNDRRDETMQTFSKDIATTERFECLQLVEDSVFQKITQGSQASESTNSREGEMDTSLPRESVHLNSSIPDDGVKDKSVPMHQNAEVHYDCLDCLVLVASVACLFLLNCLRPRNDFLQLDRYC